MLPRERKNKKIQINSELKNLKLVREFVGEEAKKFGFDEIEREMIILAVDEVCTNSIKHSYKNKPDGKITIEIKTIGNRFTVVVLYNGLLFDPSKIKVESPIKKIKKTGKIKRGKMGLYIIYKFMDDVKYQVKRGKNVVTLTKFLKDDDR